MLDYRKVLVTGGAGFIGSHLVDGLVKEGFEVTVLDDFSTGRIENLRHLDNVKMRLVKGGIQDGDAVEEALKNVEAVFHLAAISSVPYSFENPEFTYEVNVRGTRKLLEAILRSRVERFIYISTCAVYGKPEYLPIDEKHPVNPVSPYAESKLEAEQVCMGFQEVYGLKITILRPFNIYGSRQRNDQYGGVIARFIGSLCNGKRPVIYGDGLQTRDFIHVKDAVRAFMLALNCDCAGGRVFNIATGVPTSVNQLVHLLIELFGLERVKPQYLSGRQGDVRHSYADIKEAKVHLGFQPRIYLKEGLSTLTGQIEVFG